MDANREEIDLTLRVWAYISGFTIEEPVKSKAIEQSFQLAGPQVRQIARKIRRNRLPIGSNSHGYFRARNRKEYLIGGEHFRRRAISMLRSFQEGLKQFPDQSDIFKDQE
jgi:hypothetical protein